MVRDKVEQAASINKVNCLNNMRIAIFLSAC